MASSWGASWGNAWGNSWGSIAVADAPSGGWLYKTRRKTKREVYEERIKLGIIQETIEKAAKKVIFLGKALDSKVNDVYYRPDIAELVKSLMAELMVTVPSPDYRRSIEAALKAKFDEEDEESILLLM